MMLPRGQLGLPGRSRSGGPAALIIFREHPEMGGPGKRRCGLKVLPTKQVLFGLHRSAGFAYAFVGESDTWAHGAFGVLL